MPTPYKIKQFYWSARWKKVRAYKRSLERGICQRCGKAGWEVHHKTPLTINNVDDPEIATSLENLELLCTSCHDAARSKDNQVRPDVTFDEYGNLIKKPMKTS